MIFETLYEAWANDELLLIDNGFCHWHLRRDGQLTIREIFSTHKGAGNKILNILKRTSGATSIFAKCPIDLVANDWYAKQGFICEGEEVTKTGRKINKWRLSLS